MKKVANVIDLELVSLLKKVKPYLDKSTEDEIEELKALHMEALASKLSDEEPLQRAASKGVKNLTKS
jgi:hypothetical protein